jgi:hypothetical protein
LLPTPRTSRAFGLLSGIALLVLGLSIVTSPAATADAGWNVTFRDDLSGTGLPDTSNWQFTLGTSYPGGPAQFGTGEVETNTNDPANVHEAGGNLYVTPIRDSGGNWTSARIETNRADFKAPTGGQLRVDARIAMPGVTGASALGYWPAFWMLGSPYRGNPWSWPGIGEFDIMENVQGINENWATLHCGTWGGPCNEPTGISNGGLACPNSACQGNFHTYSFVWDRTGEVEQLRWYTDDQLTHTVSQSQVPADTWTQMTSHAGYFMILNVAIGGAFPDAFGGGPSAATQSGVPMVVDYVQVATQAGSGTGPTTTTSSSSPISTSTLSTSTSSTSTADGAVAPSNLHVSGTTSSTITLAWSGSAAATYDILRSGVRIATVTGTSFTDVGLFPNTPYLYSVRGAGVTTPEITATIGSTATSSSTTSTTPSPTSSTSGADAAPSNLHVSAKTASTISLAWSGRAGTSYDVLRSGIRIATVTSTSFTDIGLLPNTPYLYSVRGAGVTTPEITATL